MQDSPLQPDSGAGDESRMAAPGSEGPPPLGLDRFAAPGRQQRHRTRWQTGFNVVLVAGVLCYGIFFALHVSFKRPPEWELTPTLTIDDGSPSVWTGSAADGFLEERVTLIGTFADRGKAQETFAAMKSRLPAEAKAVLVGETMLVALPTESAFRGSCESELKALCRDVCVDDGMTRSVWVIDCIAPDRAAADQIAQETDAYVALSSPKAPLIAPWSTAPAPTAEQRKARRTYSKIIAAQSRPASHPPAARKPAARRSMARQPSSQLMAAARSVAEVRLEGRDAVDLQVVDAYAVSIGVPPSAKWPKGARPEDAYKKMTQRMGLLAAAQGGKSTRIPDDLGAPMGAITQTDLVVLFSGFTFAHIEDGLPALVDWLHAQHCNSIKYQVVPGVPARTQAEIDQREGG
jgi:hypothetical protein